jgi:hypothetical protein
MNDLIASASFSGRVFRGGARGEIYPVYKQNVVELTTELIIIGSYHTTNFKGNYMWGISG